MLNGFHWPKIITAMARKPAPATPTSKFQVWTGRHDVGQAADGTQCTGDDDACIAHLIDVDAHGVRCLRMLAAGTQTQAEAGLVQHDIADDEQDDAQRDKDAQLQTRRC